MASPYKRRKPSLIRNFWLYRRLIALAVLLGILCWFMLINHTPVTVVFPFGLATISSTTGIVILISFLAGGLATALLMTIVRALRRHLDPASGGNDPEGASLPDDRPPADYAAKTPEGFSHFQ